MRYGKNKNARTNMHLRSLIFIVCQFPTYTGVINIGVVAAFDLLKIANLDTCFAQPEAYSRTEYSFFSKKNLGLFVIFVEKQIKKSSKCINLNFFTSNLGPPWDQRFSCHTSPVMSERRLSFGDIS